MHKINRLCYTVVNSPIVWGILATVGFYSLLNSGSLLRLPGGAAWHAQLARYCAGHPIEMVEMAMFFVAISALVIKVLDLAGQLKGLGGTLLPAAEGEQTADDCPALLAHLAAAAEGVKRSYYYQRLEAALEHVRRAGSAEKLDEHLKHLSDLDLGRAQAGSSFVRIIIWAIPIMGFLGTVVGITIAIGLLSPEALEKSLPAVTSGLGVAFDTTALALVLSCALMFGQFLVDRQEGRLLEEVDRRTAAELASRFQLASSAGDPQVAAVRRMAEGVVRAAEESVRQQARLWQASLDAAQTRWSETTAAAQRQLQAALAGALEQSLESHARRLAAAAETSAQRSQEQWALMSQALGQATQAVRELRGEVAEQGQLLATLAQAAGELASLERLLQQNLAAVAGAHNFEATLESLAAVIHLLNARLGHTPSPASAMHEPRSLGHAA